MGGRPTNSSSAAPQVFPSRDVTEEEVAERLPRENDLLIVSHENPDGDALGCTVALMLMADRLGLEYRAYVAGEAGFSPEYGFLPLIERIERGGPPRIEPSTAVYILDCASPGRLNSHGLTAHAVRINIDHHQDNSRFGTFNLVDRSAASTSEILHRIFKAGSFPLDVDVATALYVGLVTDTGRFQYGNTTPSAHRMAAELQEIGVDVNDLYRRLYETVPPEKMALLGKALCRAERRLGGVLVTAWLVEQDFLDTGASEGHMEGLIDTLRGMQGARVAALARERRGIDTPECKVSLRSMDGSVNVAEIAHLWGGGGHVAAAGFVSAGTPLEVLEAVEREVRQRL